MFNAFVKLYNFHSFPTCPMLSSNSREVVEFVESIEHVEREVKLYSLTKTLNMLRGK
jgi:hypothetical protein